EIEFYINKQSMSNQGMSSKYKFNDCAEKIKVEQQSLDHWMNFNNIDKIDFIKMDVQGAEIDVLKGGIETLKKYKPVIFTEADVEPQNDADTSLNLLYSAIVELGYDVYSIKEGGKLVKINLDNIISGNWLALPIQK
ncbi:MAG: FkbM family methyltransferase, partial [Gemmataceae bacterium]